MTFSGSFPNRRRRLRILSKTLTIFSALASLAAAAAAQENSPEAAVRAIVEGEAKFYRMAEEQGTRAAFLEFLSEEAIVFQPGPVNGRKVWHARPEGAIALKWQPVYAAVSRSCDLGYTTGPAEWRKNRNDETPFGYGHFVSVWKKEIEGGWKVALDVGTENPRPPNPPGEPELSFSTEPPDAPQKSGVGTLLKLEKVQKSFARAAKWDSTAALLAVAADDVRVYREGAFPAVGKDAARLMLSVRRGELSQTRIGGGASAAGDLLYNYGSYALERDGNAERGHYLQIWRAGADEKWKLTLDFQVPAPAEQKKTAG